MGLTALRAHYSVAFDHHTRGIAGHEDLGRPMKGGARNRGLVYQGMRDWRGGRRSLLEKGEGRGAQGPQQSHAAYPGPPENRTP